ncbi:MAG: methyltransferase domain-containing protein [Vicinamibacterales bacterium]
MKTTLPTLDPQAAPSRYEAYFVPAIGGPFADALVAAAALSPGDRVLDAACGTGVVARRAAAQVGPTGEVTGVDMHPGMLEVARAAAGDVHPAPRWLESSLEAMPLADGAFDRVLCQFGLQFVEDRPAAVAEMHRVLAPGGRALISVPQPTRFFDRMRDAIARHVDPAIAGFMQVVFSWSDPDEMRGALSGAGFEQADFQVERRVLNLPPPREFLWQYVQSTPLVGALSRVARPSLLALEQDVVNDWQAYLADGGMSYEQPVTVASARRGH